MEVKKWKIIARCIMSVTWLLAFVLGLSLLSPLSYGAEPQDTIDTAYTKVLRTFYKVCSFANQADNCQWGTQAVALWVQGSSSTVLMNIRSSTSGVLGFDYETAWSYNGENTAHGVGWGGYYSCSACTCSKKNGLAYADAHETQAGSVPECNFSPANTVFPLDDNPSLVASCSAAGDSYLAKYTYSFTLNGVQQNAGVNYTCSNITVNFSTYTDLTYTYFPSPFPVDNYDNQRLYNIIAEGSTNLASDYPDYYSEVQDDVGESLDYLSQGVDVSTGVGGTNWENPFEDIHVTSTNITVNLDLTPVTQKLDILISTAAAQYDFLRDTSTLPNSSDTFVNSWYELDISTAVYNALFSWLDFSGEAWDTCITLDFSTVTFGGVAVGTPSESFCLDTIPGWDVFIGLVRFFIVFGVILWGVTYIW